MVANRRFKAVLGSNNSKDREIDLIYKQKKKKERKEKKENKIRKRRKRKEKVFNRRN